MKKREVRKTNSPSPCSYNASEVMDKFGNKAGKHFKLNKEVRETFTAVIIKKTKKQPAPGQYQSHIALDKVSRPMKSRGY
jgi:ribosomal protein S17E